MSLIDCTVKATNQYIEQMPKTMRKKYGQFFTSRETAEFMAGLFAVPKSKKVLKILDAGAGSGILSIALIEYLESIIFSGYIELVCYENDLNVLNLLEQNLEFACSNTFLNIEYEIRTDNYILSQSSEYNNLLGSKPCPEKYDLIIGNPPYLKIGKDAPEAKAMPDVCYGAPNLYFLFASMAAFNLKPNGELVYIIPRSWTSGAYFKRFREKFLHECVVEHLHLFVSRDKVFDKEAVLQETMILKAKKTTVPPKYIDVTTTNSNSDFSNITQFQAPYGTVVSNKNSYVYLVTNQEEAKVLEQLNTWDKTLPAIGLPMKTGLTVDFRNREMLRNKSEEHTVPLFYSQHIKNGKVVFPIGKGNEYIVDSQSGLLQKNTNYLFVKRFTAKEEKRRLQAGVYLSKLHPEYVKISTQNKINFIGGMKQYSECVIYGLFVIFNSSLYDKYYRILNGSTQVNSTEINSMPVPPLSVIEEMGKSLIKTKDTSEKTCDEILTRYIYDKNRRSKGNIETIASAS